MGVAVAAVAAAVVAAAVVAAVVAAAVAVTSDLLLYLNSLVTVTFSEPVVVVYNQQTVAVSLRPWELHHGGRTATPVPV